MNDDRPGLLYINLKNSQPDEGKEIIVFFINQNGQLESFEYLYDGRLTYIERINGEIYWRYKRMNEACLEHNYCRAKESIRLCDCCHKALDALDHEHEFWVAANCSLVKQNDKLLITLKQFKWISVKDKLPEINKYVLVYGDGKCCIARIHDMDEGAPDWWDQHSYGFEEVTHWMQMLPAPEEK